MWGWGWGVVRECICAFVTFLRKPLYVILYEDIFTKLLRMFMTMKTCLKKICSHLKDKMAAMTNCLRIKSIVLKLKILQLASSDLHKIYVARATCLIVILVLF